MLTILLNHLLIIAAIITIFDLFQVKNGIGMVCVLSLLLPFGYYYITHRKQKLLLPPLFIVLLQLLAITEKIMQTKDWQVFYIVIAFVYLLGYFLCYFMNQYIKFLSLNRNSASNIPEQDIFQSGVKQTLVFGGISAFVFMMTLRFDWVKKIADQIWAWILEILRSIFSGMETPPPTQDMPVDEMSQAASDIGDVIDREMFPVFLQETVKAIATGAVFIAFLGGCILLLLLIYEFAKKYLTPLKQKKNPKLLSENTDIREYCGFEKNTSKKEFGFLFLNPRERIRKIYLRRILKRKNELIGDNAQRQLEYMTAKECCERLSEQSLKVMYEKARYSAEEITSQDVKMARSK